MKKLVALMIGFSSISCFASEICTVQTLTEQSGNNNANTAPLVACTSAAESHAPGMSGVATQSNVSTLKIFIDRGYKIISTTSLSKTNDVLYTLQKD